MTRLRALMEHIGAHHAEQRDAHERDRARQRLIIILIALAAVGWAALDASRHGPVPALPLVVLAMLSVYLVLTLLHRRLLARSEPPAPLWLYSFIVLDSVVTVLAMVGAPAIMAPFYSLLMVQMVRCGMRYGLRSLWLAWGAGVAAAAALVPFSSFWVAAPELLSSFAVMMVIVPVLFAPLVRTLHQASHELRQAAGCDALTGLANRRALSARLRLARQASARQGTVLAVMLFDLDNFKSVNDTLGHGTGDRLLVQVAETLRAGCRDGDVIARLGGDEFVVLLEGLPAGTGVALARDRANRLVGMITEAARPLAPGLGVSASAGVYCWQAGPGTDAAGDDEGDESDLLTQADRAMYECKRAGKGRVAVSAPQVVGTPAAPARPLVALAPRSPATEAPTPRERSSPVNG